MYSFDTKRFAGCCKQRFLRPFMTLQQDVSKVSLYNLVYICTLLELLFYSELNGVLLSTLYAQVAISYAV